MSCGEQDTLVSVVIGGQHLLGQRAMRGVQLVRCRLTAADHPSAEERICAPVRWLR